MRRQAIEGRSWRSKRGDAGDGRALARRRPVGRRDLRDGAARRVRGSPEREALTDGTRRLSYRELADGIDRMAVRCAP